MATPTQTSGADDFIKNLGKIYGLYTGGFLAFVILIVILTLGIGFAWAEVRTMRFVLEHIALDGDADLNAVVQTEQEHKNAMADDLGDLLDIGVFI